ncbi:hypothetical protein ABLN86_12615, partial [Mycobacterium tuberculosis]
FASFSYQFGCFNRQTPFIDFRFRIYRETLSRFSCAASLGVALSAYEHWLRDESVSLTEALGAAFDVVGAGLDRLNQ